MIYYRWYLNYISKTGMVGPVNLQQLYYFRTLAEMKHFTKASVKLMVAQPSLSHSINDLESELGISLFNRNNRQVTLTKYGQLFLEYVDQALSILDEGQLKLNDFISPEQGTVSLHYVSSIDPFIPYLLARYFQDTGFQTTFQLQQDTNIHIQNHLLSGEADLGLGMLYDEADGLKTHKLANHELVLLVASNHPLARKGSVDLREIQGENFIAYKRECSIRDLIDDILRSLQVRPRIVLETIHDTMIFGSVAANLGVALVPAPLSGHHYNIKALALENDIPGHELYLKWKDMKYISPAVCRFRDYVINQPGLFQDFRKKGSG